jgi:SAM-dependent methyltransferase
VDELIAANRAQWDERAAIHLESRFYDVEGWLRDQRGPRPHEIRALGNVEGLRLVHPQCHFGLDTLAWARAGAEVTGIDFSPVAIEAARRIARRAGLARRATFVCASVDDAEAALDGAVFDVVYVSLGALCWLPSVDRWAQMVGALLSPGGRLYVHDGHPLAWALSEDDLRIAHTYFEEAEPFIDDSAQTYTDATRALRARRSYEWNHGIGEIVTALIRHGLRITELTEHDWTVWKRWPWLVEVGEGAWTNPPGMPRVPLTFTLLAERTALSRSDAASRDDPGPGRPPAARTPRP